MRSKGAGPMPDTNLLIRKSVLSDTDAYKGTYQLITLSQAVQELANVLPAKQYNSRLEIALDLAEGNMICTNFYSYKLEKL
jgi:hypothetical protein